MRNSFEHVSDERMDIERFHTAAIEVMERDRVKETDFIEPYGAEMVQSDMQRVESLEGKFDERGTEFSDEMKKIADIFEAIILWNSEQSEWLGPNAVTIKSSKYDDYVNGVDAIVEFQSDGQRSASYVGLGTDITFSQDTTKKFDRLKKQIDDGELAKVKYFHSEFMHLHGQLSKLPEVVVGADKSMVLELAELWAGKKFKALSEHRIQIMMLLQSQEQLKTFALYAESIGKLDIAEVYRSRLIIIENILEQKKELVAKTKYEINDTVHSSIMSFMVRWQKQLQTK